MLMRSCSVALGLFVSAYVLRGGDLLFGFLNLTLVFLAMAVAGVFLYFTLRRRIRYQPSWADAAVLALALVMLANSSDREGLEKALRFGALVALPFFLARAVLVNGPQVRRFLYTLLAASSAIAFIVVAHSLAPGMIQAAMPYVFGDHYGRFLLHKANGIALATLFLTGAMVRVGLAPAGKRRKRWLAYAMAGLLIYGVFLTGTRGAVAAAVAAPAVLWALRFIRRPARVCFLTLAVLALGYVVFDQVSAIIEMLPNWQRIREPLLAVLHQSGTLGPSIESRLLVYSHAAARFLDNPLFGVGTAGMYVYVDHVTHGEHVTYAHNIFLETGAELGLAGLAPLCVLIVLALRNLLKYMLLAQRGAGDARLVTAVFLAVVSLLVAKQFSGNLSHHKDLFVMFAVVFNFPLLLGSPRRAEAALQRPASLSRIP